MKTLKDKANLDTIKSQKEVMIKEMKYKSMRARIRCNHNHQELELRKNRMMLDNLLKTEADNCLTNHQVIKL